jgi:hypothetical protein
MSEQLAKNERVMADFDRRLRTLETTQRVGLNRIKFSYATAATDPTVFAAWEPGATGTTWADSTGAVGNGYGEVTLETNNRVLVFFGARVINVANDAGVTFRTLGCRVGFGIDGVLPDALPAPTGQRTANNLASAVVDMHPLYVVPRTVGPGVHTFKAWAFWQDTFPAAPVLPRMTDTFLGVLPID